MAADRRARGASIPVGLALLARLVLAVAGCGLCEVLPGTEHDSRASSTPDSQSPDLDTCPMLHRGQTDPIRGRYCVTALQSALRSLGYPDQPVTGRFGELTDANVRDFQRRHNIEPVSGIVGPRTRDALQAATTPPPPDLSACPPLHRGQTDPIDGRYCVTALQSALRSLGYPDQPVTGRFGELTDANVRDFQRRHNIEPVSGIVGPRTRKALVAGGAAPAELSAPPVPASGHSPP